MVSSMVIVPFLGLVLGGGVLIIALSLLGSLPGFIAQLYDRLIGSVNYFVGWLARQDTFFFEDIPFDWLEVMLGYALLTVLVILLKRPAAFAFRNMLIVLLLFQGYGIYVSSLTRQTGQVYILHQFGHPVLVHQQGPELEVHGLKTVSGSSLINDFQVGARIKKLRHLPLEKNYIINGKHLTRIDSTGIEVLAKRKGILWLTYSPRINLDRYIAYCDPALIIADGSNYHYLVRQWERSAAIRNVPFHFTGKQGAFLFAL